MALQLPASLLEFPREQLRNPILDEHIPAYGLNHVDIDMQFLGQLLICFDAEETVSLKANGNPYLLPHRIDRVGDRLIITARNVVSLLKRLQQTKLVMELHVPQNCNINVSFIAGAVALYGGTGSLAVKGAFGEVAGLSYSRAASIRISCGTVALNELPGEADVRIGFGSTEMGWSDLRGSEQVKVRCGLGSIDLMVAPQYAAATDCGGFFKNKKIATPSGSKIEATVGLGGLETAYA